MHFARILVFLLAIVAGTALAQERANTNRGTELRERASGESRVLATLPENAPVTVLNRSGGWTEVDAGGQRGWVRVFHLRFAATVETGQRTSGSSFFGGVGSALGLGGQKRNDQAKIATIGIRGLSEEELRNASPDPEALRRLQSFRAARADAERFAREARLAAQRVAYEEGR